MPLVILNLCFSLSTFLRHFLLSALSQGPFLDRTAIAVAIATVTRRASLDDLWLRKNGPIGAAARAAVVTEATRKTTTAVRADAAAAVAAVAVVAVEGLREMEVRRSIRMPR